MDNKEKILEYCASLELDTIGISSCRQYDELTDFFKKRKSKEYENEFEEKNIEKRINPQLSISETDDIKRGKVIISIAFPYLFEKEIKRLSHEDVAERENKAIGRLPFFSKYTRGRDYHEVVGEYLKKICSYIEGLGGKAIYFVDSNSLPERHIAMEAGIGFIGKNNTLITEKYGSYVFLGEIITDLDLEVDEAMQIGKGSFGSCEGCNLCERACPTKCLKGKDSNPNECLSYITQKKHIEEEWLNKLGGRLFGCDTCQDVCPFNKQVKFSLLEEFKPLDFMTNLDVNELIDLDNESFKKKYKCTSCGWRGKNIIIRNAMIHYVMTNKEQKALKYQSPYLQEYYERVIRK